MIVALNDMFFNSTIQTVNDAANGLKAIGNDVTDIQNSLTSLGNKLQKTSNGTNVLIRKFVYHFFLFLIWLDWLTICFIAKEKFAAAISAITMKVVSGFNSMANSAALLQENVSDIEQVLLEFLEN